MNPPTGEVISNKRGKIVLREWLLQHRNNPYPTRAETRILADLTELTTKQVGYWFSNARKRIMQKGEYPGKQTKTDHIILREWLFQHRYRPYPTRAETLILANETENTITQVRNWFSNARKRILPEIIRREGGTHRSSSGPEFVPVSSVQHPAQAIFLRLPIFAICFFWVQNILPRCLIGLLTKMAQQNIFADPVTKNAFSPI